jgi:hypothetical protein
MNRKIGMAIGSCLLLRLLLLANPAQAEQNPCMDSLLNLLPHTKNNSNKVLLLISIGTEAEARDLEGARKAE